MLDSSLMYKRIRNWVGFLGMILPYLALFSAGIVIPKPHYTWWWSISATYYQSPALVAVLTSASIVLMCYDGYDKLDNIITTLSGIFGLCIILFPCEVDWIPYGHKVGFFQLPMNVSKVLHGISAGTFFTLLAFNSFFLFTKTDKTKQMTDRKKIRNIIYRVCGIGMFIFGIWQIVTLCVEAIPNWWTMINEIVMLQFFGISWLVKGEAFPFICDK